MAGLDIVIVRELTSGVYFGEPRGIFVEGNERVGINTQRYTESEIARAALRSAFELARRRSNKVCSMEKANVMESGILWREVVQEVHDKNTQMSLSHTCTPMQERCNCAVGPSSLTSSSRTICLVTSFRMLLQC